MTILLSASAMIGALIGLSVALALGYGPVTAALSMPLLGSIAALLAALAGIRRNDPPARRPVPGSASEPELVTAP
jgi:hypothetical protein